MPVKRRSVLTGLAGAAMHLPLPGLLHAQSGGNADLIWQTDADRSTDTSAYNRRTAKTPAHRALCQTEAGVAQALRWAQDRDMPFSIQSGGHCFAGLSQSDHLIIDLRHLNHVALTGDTQLSTGPGATLGDANLATAPTGQVLPAGYCQNVGIGGHIGGGGLGVLSRGFGLACDHLTAARVLLADGQIVTASAKENPDLFWALRGGGSGSFGIVTDFTFRLQHVPTATFAESFWILDHTTAAQFIADWQSLNEALDPAISSYLYLSSHAPGRARIRVRMVATTPEAASNKAIADLQSLAPSLTEPFVLKGSFDDIAEQVWPRAHDLRAETRAASNYLGAFTDTGIWTNVLIALDAHISYQPSVSIEVLGGAIDDLSPDATAYVHRRSGSFLVQIQVNDLTQDDAAETDAALREVQATLVPATVPGAYVNYPDRGLTDWAQQYWGQNLARLQQIKRHYDPEDVFQHAQSIRP